MQGFLDLYMIRSREFDERSRQFLAELFSTTIALAENIFGELLFRPYSAAKKRWSRQPQKAFADAVLVSLSERLPSAQQLTDKRDAIIDATRELFSRHPTGTFTGRGNTKRDVQERIMLFGDMLSQFG